MALIAAVKQVLRAPSNQRSAPIPWFIRFTSKVKKDTWDTAEEVVAEWAAPAEVGRVEEAAGRVEAAATQAAEADAGAAVSVLPKSLMSMARRFLSASRKKPGAASSKSPRKRTSETFTQASPKSFACSTVL